MTAFITGTTSGFGYAFALRMASLGYNLVITGRRAERLAELSKKITNEYKVKVHSLCFDVRNQAECISAIKSLPEEFQQIDVLINNAGLAAGAAPFDESDIVDFEQMIDTNVKGLLFVTKQIVPQMVARKSGRIVNISSIAGIEVYPGGSVYCATKHAVNAITKGLRVDLVKHGIQVNSISPGMVETEFSIVRYHGDEAKAKAVYAGIVPLTAEDIADTLEFIVTRPPHVSINDIQINPVQQANTYIANRNN
jgi:Short-chain alcohol dehydrogenase of unknown specificity